MGPGLIVQSLENEDHEERGVLTMSKDWSRQ